MHREGMEHPHDPEREHQLSLRAEYVMHHYLLDHPDTALREDVERKQMTLERAYRILVETGLRDPKTGVHRADLLKYALEYELYQTRETNQPTSIGIFDIDDFKNINTELGHVRADEILRQIAELIRAVIRTSDDLLPASDDTSIIRWGGEEFVVIFSGASQTDAQHAAERIRQSVANAFLGWRPNGTTITLSGGIAEASLNVPVSVNELLQQADEQLLVAKESGKNTIFPKIETQE